MCETTITDVEGTKFLCIVNDDHKMHVFVAEENLPVEYVVAE